MEFTYKNHTITVFTDNDEEGTFYTFLIVGPIVNCDGEDYETEYDAKNAAIEEIDEALYELEEDMKEI